MRFFERSDAGGSGHSDPARLLPMTLRDHLDETGIFHDADKAREWLESRLWKNGAICPHCGTVGEATLMKGKSHRPGLYQCNACREPFTVTVGTIYERSKVPLNKWLAATHLMMASKKGMSALEIGRLLGLSKKTAWFLCHRIRESLRETKYSGPIGSGGGTVEIDETYIGGNEPNKHKSKRQEGAQGGKGKEPVMALVERGGKVRSFHVAKVTAIPGIVGKRLTYRRTRGGAQAAQAVA